MSLANPISLEVTVDSNHRLKKELRNHYFAPLEDTDVPVEYTKTWLKWKKLSVRMQYKGPCAWLVRPGFSFFNTASSLGPCFGGLEVLQHCHFFDEPTRESVVFWIPKILPWTLHKTTKTQKAVLDLFRSDYDLPHDHLTSFGSVSLLSGLVLSYYRISKVRSPGNLFVRTNSFSSDRSRFSLGWSDKELIFELWRGDEQRFPSLGIFPIGVESVILPPFE